MKNRIKEIRKINGLTQQEFADKLGVSKQNIVNYECRDKIPSQSAIANICRTFNVNETWLLTGTGEMTSPVTREQEVAAIASNLFKEDENSFKYKLIKLVSQMTDEQVQMCKDIIKKLCD